ncbi:G1/S-specific cyclin pas1 [Cytospora mali]|uniref:G1/S-specific cyclin pas1 n=1 Tax=Cytospora mali TaxID=578113 RepID=A0A194V8K7_CYTMA|nr:G1/S-specific cyclin pas1 [Valsa mali var. pyri (nom. inval.)]
MKSTDVDSPVFVPAYRNVLYTSSLASSATASSASVSSDASSQSSDDTTTSSLTDYSDSCNYLSRSRQTFPQTSDATLRSSAGLPQGLRQNPRRTSNSSTTRSGCPPTLVRQAERKLNFVDNLVDSSTQIVEAIWPTSSVQCREETGNSSVLPLRTFIQETLRRSRTSYSTLQVALYYLVLIKDHLPDRDFTMEQTDDCHASRALQCGRRMFLSALILASKYLQDRNYSARAWSKISGLATHEINQNEMAFLLTVDWNLHITEEVYNRWTDCVMKHTPSQPPSPGSGIATMQFERQCEDFKRIILLLKPDLENLEDIIMMGGTSPAPSLSPRSLSPRAILAAAQDNSGMFDCGSSDVTPTPRVYSTPNIMEPAPSPSHTVCRLPPSFGLLPTPRLTPQPSAIREPSPALASMPQSFGRSSSMSMAMSAAGNVQSTVLDRWPITSSPQNYYTRRSSLANSVSTASSPESMISDSSRTSRSSSISSASSLTSAPYTKLDVVARCRSAKLCSERYAMRPTIASVPEDYEETISSSPEYFVGSASCGMSLDTLPMKRECEIDDATNDAARALQELHDNWRRSCGPSQLAQLATSAPKAGSKRSRPLSVEHGLQENVREMLYGPYNPLSSGVAGGDSYQVAVPSSSQDSRKRVCCSTEAAQYSIPSMHPAMGGLGGPGMWAGILN